MLPHTPLNTAKVVMLGDSSVGKTSIVSQFYQSEFQERAEPTIGASYITKTIDLDEGKFTLHIWDTAGQEQYQSVVPMYTRGCSAAIVVFSLQNKESFLSLPRWIALLEGSDAPDCKVYLVGNKNDLGPCEYINEAEQYAAQVNTPLILTSAKDGESVRTLFLQVATDVSKMTRKGPTIMQPSRIHEKNEQNSSGCCK